MTLPLLFVYQLNQCAFFAHCFYSKLFICSIWNPIYLSPIGSTLSLFYAAYNHQLTTTFIFVFLYVFVYTYLYQKYTQTDTVFHPIKYGCGCPSWRYIREGGMQMYVILQNLFDLLTVLINFATLVYLIAISNRRTKNNHPQQRMVIWYFYKWLFLQEAATASLVYLL